MGYHHWCEKSPEATNEISNCSKDKAKVQEKMRYEIAMADKGSPIVRDKHTASEYPVCAGFLAWHIDDRAGFALPSRNAPARPFISALFNTAIISEKNE